MTTRSSVTASAASARAHRVAGRREAIPRMRRLAILAWRAWGHYRATRALQALSPEMLKDIGVPFCDIESAVRDGRPQGGRRPAPRGGRT